MLTYFLAWPEKPCQLNRSVVGQVQTQVKIKFRLNFFSPRLILKILLCLLALILMIIMGILRIINLNLILSYNRYM